jgi:hypothetical protein
MRMEVVERRVLGAIDFVDAVTGAPVREPVQARVEGARLIRGRGGRLIVWSANGLETHITEFQTPPAEPALESVPLQISILDAGKDFLPRRATIRLPRDPNPANAANPSSLFQPISVALFAAPASTTAAGWAVLHVSVRDQNTGLPVAGALVRVLRASDSSVLARGMSDWRGRVAGEALVGVPGIPVTTFNAGDGAVLTTQVDANVEVIFDSAADLSNPPDPDDLEARRPTLRRATVATQLRWGQRQALAIAVP